MKAINKSTYSDYKKDKSFYDLQDISNRQLALLERFTPAIGKIGPIYSCDAVVLISGDELVNDREESLGTLWNARLLAAVNPKKQKGVVERYDILLVTVGDQAYRLSSEVAEYAEPGYHVTLSDIDTILATDCITIINGIDMTTSEPVEVQTPEWFISSPKMANPLLQ